MSKIKLIALDMDGTLLNSKKEISEHTYDVLKKAIEKGIYIVPATGRAINGLPDFFQNLDIKYGIFCNGASCYDLEKKELIAKTHFTIEEAISLLKIGEKYDVCMDVYAGGCGYSEAKYLDHFDHYTKDPGIQLLIRSTRKRLEEPLEKFLRRTQTSVEKVNLFFCNLEEREVARQEFLKTDITMPVSALYNNLELSKLGSSKGNALMQIANYLEIKKEEVMACGDGGNDLSMIEAAGIGVAMENAMPEIKEAADFITTSNNNEGVANAIEKFVG